MLKKITAVLLALLIAILLCGCVHRMDTLGDGEHTATHFSVVDRYDGFSVVIDMDTGVMYAMSATGNNYGTLTLLVNWDGSPRTYPAFDAREDRYG